jgi:uncharacterized protein (DUF2336 family)
MNVNNEKFSIKNLIALAKEKTVDANSELADNITDLFLSDEGRLNEHERALMGDILCKLISSVERSIKIQMSKKLKNSKECPADLINFLANDNIQIAEPILSNYQALADDSLIEIIRNRTDAHRMAIAIRTNVSAEVCDELIVEGSDDVVECLIRNSGAEISDSALDYLVAESKTLDRFQEPLLCRDDLPAELAHKMYWWVSAKLRSKIMNEFHITENTLDDLVEDSTLASINLVKTGSSVMDKALVLSRKLNKEGKINFPFILKCLRQEKINLSIASFSILMGLNVKLVWRMFREKTGDSLAISCKSLGVDRNEFTNFYLLALQAKFGSGARATSLLTSVLKMYDELDITHAKAAVGFWRRNESFKDAVLNDQNLNINLKKTKVG